MTGSVKDNGQLIQCLHCILIVRISLKRLQVAKMSGRFHVGSVQDHTDSSSMLQY